MFNDGLPYHHTFTLPAYAHTPTPHNPTTLFRPAPLLCYADVLLFFVTLSYCFGCFVAHFKIFFFTDSRRSVVDVRIRRIGNDT